MNFRFSMAEVAPTPLSGRDDLLYTPSIEGLFIRMQKRCDLELTVGILEAVVKVWDGFHVLGTVCPLWAHHASPDGQSNMTFHRLAVYASTSLCQIFSYYALLHHLELPPEDNMEQLAQLQARTLDVISVLDPVRVSATAASRDPYVPLPAEILKASMSLGKLVERPQQHQSQQGQPQKLELQQLQPLKLESQQQQEPQWQQEPVNQVTEGATLLQLLNDIRSLLEAPQTDHEADTAASTDQTSTHSSPCMALSTEVKLDQNESSQQDAAVFEGLLTCLEHASRAAEENISDMLEKTPPTKKRQRTTSVAGAGGTAAHGMEPRVDRQYESVLASPCQGVCWDPTHQRWVAHWSDAQTHQRIRRYFSPKVMGFKHARLLAMLTRKEAVESGRASMTAKCDRLKSRTEENGDQDSMRGLYWCPETQQWYCYWKTPDSEDLHVRGFPIADHLNETNGDVLAASAAARLKALDCRSSVLAALLSSPSGATSLGVASPRTAISTARCPPESSTDLRGPIKKLPLPSSSSSSSSSLSSLFLSFSRETMLKSSTPCA